MAYGDTKRKVFVADSFKGLPKPEMKQDSGSHFHEFPFLSVSRREVEENFRKYDLLDSQVVFLEGLFKDTLPGVPIDKLSVLRLDGDMYASTWDALVNLYPKLSKGGFCIIDDWTLTGCRQAVEDYRNQFNITSLPISIDKFSIYWRK